MLECIGTMRLEWHFFFVLMAGTWAYIGVLSTVERTEKGRFYVRYIDGSRFMKDNKDIHVLRSM